MTELDLLRKEVHAKGFNISVLINKFKKTQRERKATYEVPDEVFIAVCKEYLKKGAKINKSYPYFMKVLTLKAHEYCANKNIERAQSNKFGRMPESIKALMRSI